MKSSSQPRGKPRSWKAFSTPEGERVDRDLRAGRSPCCPRCGEWLEAQPGSRLSPCLVLDATAYDLSCRGCRRFWCVVRHTARSVRLVRMRRFVAAVRAVEPAGGGAAARLAPPIVPGGAALAG
jgi:hypothetical protein